MSCSVSRRTATGADARSRSTVSAGTPTSLNTLGGGAMSELPTESCPMLGAIEAAVPSSSLAARFGPRGVVGLSAASLAPSPNAETMSSTASGEGRAGERAGRVCRFGEPGSESEPLVMGTGGSTGGPSPCAPCESLPDAMELARERLRGGRVGVRC